jgi:hypothetical protein
MTPTTTYADLLGVHLADPTPETLEPLRDAVRSAPGFDPELRVREQAAALLREGRHDDAVTALEASMPGSLLSPAAHAMLATALRHTGRPEGAARHARLARAALEGILATGDGTAERPWSVLRISDEYDVVDSLGTRPVSQGLLVDGARRVDRVECQDGRTLHFDVTRVPGAAVRA